MSIDTITYLNNSSTNILAKKKKYVQVWQTTTKAFNSLFNERIYFWGIYIYNFPCTYFPFHILFLKASSAQYLFMHALKLIYFKWLGTDIFGFCYKLLLWLVMQLWSKSVALKVLRVSASGCSCWETWSVISRGNEYLRGSLCFIWTL